MGTVKTLKAKLIVILIVFMMLFGNLGFTMSAIATSEAFEVIDNGFFRKDEIKFNAYFEDEDGNDITELTGDVNEDLKLVLEIFPQVEGFLKDGTIKAVSSDGSDINFEFTAITQNLLETSKFEETIEHANWTNTSVSLAEYAGKNVVVGLRHFEAGTRSFAIYVDNVKLTPGRGSR